MNDGSQIAFQPNIESVQEFKVQSNAFSAEYGRNGGIVINAVSKSGGNRLHGSLFEYFRNDRLDALNFFDLPRAIAKEQTGREIQPFKRNIFGGSVGGPVFMPGYDGRNKTFFFTSYEGRRQRESETLAVNVPTATQRATATDPVVVRLLTLVTLPNTANPVSNFVGQAPRRRNLDQTTVRIDHVAGSRNMLFGSYSYQVDSRNEASSIGFHNLPGFGDIRPARRQLFSFNYTGVFTPSLTGELRLGGNRFRLDFITEAQQVPADFGMSTGVFNNFPDIRIAGGPAFGDRTGQPNGRRDTTYQGNYTVAWIKSTHSLKFGVQLREFINNSYNSGTGGQINFSSITSFLAGQVVRSSIQLGETTPAISSKYWNFFVQDDYKVSRRLTLNVGVRYEFNTVPRERYNRLSIFDTATQSLIEVGSPGFEQAYDSDRNNFSPRLGFSWDPTGKGRTAIRGGAGLCFDQPLFGSVTGMATNPLFASQLVFTTSGIPLASPFKGGGTSTISPTTVTRDFTGAVVPQYKLQPPTSAMGTVFQAGYMGSAGRRLTIRRDINQGVRGVRPLPNFGPLTLYEPTSRSSYNALWFSANRRLSKGVTFNASYTFSKSIDLNSTSGDSQIQNSYDLNAEKGLSDFDARRRFVISGVYQLPSTGGGLWRHAVADWSLSGVGNYQSGNPFNPVVSTLRSGSLNTYDRPDVVSGASLTVVNPDPALFFNTGAFVLNELNKFGNAGRNILTGPDLASVDIAALKNFRVRESVALQFRAEAFNVMNRPNFGQPGTIVGTPSFGVIQNTRSTRGDFGSSRQIEFVLKLLF